MKEDVFWSDEETRQANGFILEANVIINRAEALLQKLIADPFAGLSWRRERIDEVKAFIKSAKTDALYFHDSAIPF